MLKISLEERKDYIAKIATKLFSEKGYQTATLQDMSQEANLSKAGMYHYFKSKADILAYIFIRHSDQFLDTLNLCITKSKEKGLNPQEAFKELARTYANHINVNKDYRSLVLRERHQLTGNYKIEIFRREQALFRLLKNELGKIQNRDKKINLNVSAFLLIAMSHWLGYWFKEDGELNLKTIIEQNIGAIFNGILKR